MVKKTLAVLLALLIVCSLGACTKKEGTQETQIGQTDEGNEGSGEAEAGGTYDTLVIGLSELNRVFNPFYYTSAMDAQIMEQVFDEVMELNEKNELIPHAGDLTYEEIQDETGEVKQVLYTISLKDGIQFSDGTPVTIDDLIFTYYVVSDPMYDGMSVFNTMNIEGLKEYYYDTPDYSDKIQSMEEESKDVSDEEVMEVIQATVDADIAQYGEAELNNLLDLGLDETASDFETQVKEAYIEICKEDWDTYVGEAQAAKYTSLKSGYITGNLEDGIDVSEIVGIKKIDELTCTVLVNGVDINAERQLGLTTLMPKHYYGVDSNGNEYSKGNLAPTKTKNEVPLGSGPFVYEEFNNNIVTLKANPNYFLGAPKIPNLKYQVVSDNNKIDSVILGEIDVTDPSASKEAMQELKENEIQYSLVDNNGYGYIALSAKRIPDINVRKGLLHLMNRKPAIESYYGELATVIERPMTTTLAEYPQGAAEFYGYDPAKAAEYFEKGGYTKNASGDLVDKNGKKLSVEIVISQLASHPSAAILTQMKTDMDNLGAEFIISDLDANVMFDRMNKLDADMWVAAWTNANDCDISQMFHSSKAGIPGGNLTFLMDDKLDDLLSQTLKTVDLEERKKLVSQELDIVMEWAVYMPVYQRKNLFIYNPEVVNMDTVPETTSPYWTYQDTLYQMELN